MGTVKNTKTKNKPESFLPDGYEQPKTGGGDNYLKFEDGTTRFRVLSRPKMGSLAWDKESKPHRFQMGETPAGTWKEKPRHFWALVVWNYDKKRPQILEITQATVISAIVELYNDADWGAPWNYDLKVTKTGSGKDGTKYSTTPSPVKPISQDIRDAVSEWEIDLEMIFVDGGDPFVSIPSGVQSDFDANDDDDQDEDDQDEDDQDAPDDMPFK